MCCKLATIDGGGRGDIVLLMALAGALLGLFGMTLGLIAIVRGISGRRDPGGYRPLPDVTSWSIPGLTRGTRPTAAADGTVLAEPAVIFDPAGGAPVPGSQPGLRGVKGQLRLGSSGLNFRESDERMGRPLIEVALTWTEVATINIVDGSSSRGELHIVTTTGRSLAWRITNPARVWTAIDELRTPIQPPSLP